MHTAFVYIPALLFHNSWNYYSRHDFSELRDRRNIVQTPKDGQFGLVGGKLGYFRKIETFRKRGSKFEKFEFLKMCLYYLRYRLHFVRVYSP